MATVIGLDLSLTRTGIAVLAGMAAAPPAILVDVGFASRDSKSYRDRNRRVRAQCRAVCEAINPATVGDVALAVLEGPLPHPPKQAYEWDRAGLWHGVFGQLDAWKIPIAVVNPATLKRWATGKGNADKPAMLAAARQVWPVDVANDDQADALHLAGMGWQKLGLRLPWEPHRWQHEGLLAVDWPADVEAAA